MRQNRSTITVEHPAPRACVVCGSHEGPEVFSTRLDICGLGPVAFAIRCCAGCGMTQQDPAVAPETLERQYRLFSNYTQFRKGPPPLSPSTARMLALTARHRLVPGRIYEIGAATGAALWHFRRAGWSVAGCDPSALAVDQAWTFNRITLDLGDERDVLGRQGRLDLVSLSHVLEHLADPLASLRRMRDALGPGGMLLFEVPCLIAPQLNPPGLYTLEHLNYFDETSLANLLAMAGFSIVEANTTLDHWPFPVITILARQADPKPDPRNAFAEAWAFCESYAVRDCALWAAVEARIKAVIALGEPVSIWGAGVHTSMLLARTSLAQHAAIAAITDRDSQKHGHLIGGHPVVPAAEALALGGKVVVSSYYSEAEIAADLIASGLAPERVVRLHGGPILSRA
jgi:SAM-dependent methyltransferase